MAIEKIKKYKEVLKFHLKFIEETEPENKKEKKHFEKISKTITLILDSIESNEIEELVETKSKFEASEEKLKSLETQLEEAPKESEGASKEQIEEEIRENLEKEYGELIDELEKENKLLSEKSSDSDNSELLEKITSLEKIIKEKDSKIKELSKSKGEKGKDSEVDLEKIREEIKNEFEKKISSLEKEVSSLNEQISKSEIENKKIGEETPVKSVEKPTNYDDLSAWEAYLDENPEDEDGHKAIKKIEKKARKDEDHQTLAAALVTRFEFLIFDTDEEGSEIIKEATQIYEIEIGDLEKAFYALKILFDVHPENEDLLKDLLRIAGEGNLWESLITEFLELIEDIEDEEIAAKLYLNVARVYNERLKKPQLAIDALNKALDEKKDCAEALDEKASILKRLEEWNELIKTLEMRLRLSSDNEEKAFYIKEIGNIKETKLNEPIMAARTYEEVFSVVPDDVETIVALESIYNDHELYEPLAAILERKIESVDNVEDARIARRNLGFLYANHLNDHNRAIDILEHLVEVLHDDIKLHRVLSDLYEGTGRMRGYLKTARRLAELTDMEGEKVDLYKRIATELTLSPSTRIKACADYKKVLELRPDSIDVYEALEDIYEQEELYDDLVEIISKHVEVIESESTKAKLLQKQGAIYLEKLEKPEKAVVALEESNNLKGKKPKTLRLLSKSYSLLDECEKNAPILEILSELLEGDERSSILAELGSSLIKINEVDKAEEVLHKALAFNDSDFSVLKDLGEIYSIKGQWARAVSYLERALLATTNKLEQGEVVLKAATLLSDKLEEKEKAISLWEKLMELSPGHPKAVRTLADYYAQKEQFEKAAPLMHLVTTEIEALDKKEKVNIYITAGKVALAVNEVDKAASYLEKARELEPTSLEVLINLAELRYRREEWDGALSLYQALLVAHRDSITKEKVAEIYYKLGGIKEIKGDTLKAISFYDKALEVNPHFSVAAEAVLKLRENNEDYETVAKIKLKKIEDEEDIDKKLDMIGDLIRFYVETVKDPESAVEIQEMALKLRPDDRGVINDALDLYHICERWDKVVNSVLKLAELEDPGLLRSKYNYSAGLIYLEELGDDIKALEQFNICLDQDPENEMVFDKILEVLEAREDWHEMTKAIRAQLKRNDGARSNLQLWEKLGHLYLDQLGDMETAIAAFEYAAKMAPSFERTDRLAKLYIKGGEAFYPKAENAYLQLLSENPQQIDIIRNVLTIAKTNAEKDKVWNLCGVLSVYKDADKKEITFYDKYRTNELIKASSILTDDLWRKLKSPEEDDDLNTILSGIGHHLSLYYSYTYKKFGLKRSQSYDVDKMSFGKIFNYVTRTLLITHVPELYNRDGLPIPIQVVNLKDKDSLVPSWLIENKKFQNMNDMELAYHFSRELIFMRPERFFRRLAPDANELKNAIYATFKVLLGDKAPKIPKDHVEKANKLVEYIQQNVPSATIQSLKKAAKRFASKDFDNSVARWIRANHKTSIRASVLLTGDLKHVLSWVLSEQDNLTQMRAKERVAEVMKFVLSPEYYELREQLGLGIK